MKNRTGSRILAVILCAALFFPHVAFAMDSGEALTDPDENESVSSYVYSEPVEETPAEDVDEEDGDIIESIPEDYYSLEDDIDLEAMEAGLEENPEPLTMADLIADFNLQPPLMTQRMSLMSFAPASVYPETIVIGNDNENNAHTGRSDGDIDKYLSGYSSNYPIEIYFTLDHLPAESAYIAVKAYDVDEEYGEKDYVFINDAPAGKGIKGESIGYLSGNNGKWNTTMLEIPLSKLKLGKNHVSITISPGWCVTIDWIQFILDGGAEDTSISDFSIKLDDAVLNGSNVEIASSVNIVQSGSTEYYTEYMLNNAAGDNLSSYFGRAVKEETVSLSMPLNSPTGRYTVTALIKDKTFETIKASDTITFDFVRGEVPSFGPKASHSLSPATLTNGNVSMQLSVENSRPNEIRNVQIWYKGGDITDGTVDNITTANQSVSENGTYDFIVKYSHNGVARTSAYSIAVSNIDKVGPVIAAENFSIIEDTGDVEVLAAVESAITVTDNISLPADSYNISAGSGYAATLEEKVLTITARDTAGNESTKDITLTVIPKPVKITQHDADVNTEELTASLTATLDYTGGLSVTESGFVWGVSQNPTYEVCNGKKSVAGAVAKGGSISAAGVKIIKGVNYYARAYVKAGGLYYYSEQKNFGVDAPNYGSFRVTTTGDVPAGGGTAVFTISRPSNQTEGNQTVYYRTVNGTAIGGTHYVHNAGTLIFEEGQYSKDVTVTVHGVSRQYGSYAATAYQNTDRSFSLEIYKVEGGATIGTKRTEKSILADGTKTIAAKAYNQYNSVDTINNDNYSIYDNNGSDDGYNWTNNPSPKDTVSFTKVGDTDCAYLNATIDHYGLKYNLTISEKDDGYQLIQVTSSNTPHNFAHSNVTTANYPSLYYGVAFEHVPSGIGSSASTYMFPNTTYSSKGILTDGGSAVNIGRNNTVYVHYSASGKGYDNWYKSNFTPSVRAIDAKEPQLLGIAPMAGGTYAYNDEVYISLIFDEIVGSASGLTVNTSVSDNAFEYVEGIGTNVLVFRGRIDKEGQNFESVMVNSINGINSIKDLAAYNGTASGSISGSTGIDANTYRPAISFEGSSTGTLPRHAAAVTIGDAASAQYAWTKGEAMPVSGWMDFSSAAGSTLTETMEDGTWYLHILATHSNGNIRWEYKVFEFQQPTMDIAVNNAAWAQSRNITLSVSNSTSAPVTISMTGAGTGTYTGSRSINVTENGIYTFTLTDDYGSSIIKSIEVFKIDRVKPVITLNEYENTEARYTSLEFGAAARDEDGGSGLSTLEYKWTNSSAVPSDGWMPIDAAGVPVYSETGSAYLHVKAVDFAGNTAFACSQGYEVVDNTPPSITVTGGSLSS